MEESIWCRLCRYLIVNYRTFALFLYWSCSIRKVATQIQWASPQVPRLSIDVSGHQNRTFGRKSSLNDTKWFRSSSANVDVYLECSVTPPRLSCCEELQSANGDSLVKSTRPTTIVTTTPDIVRTIRKHESQKQPSQPSPSKMNSTFKKLEELHEQLSQMRRDISDLVQLQQQQHAKKEFEIISIIQPIVSQFQSGDNEVAASVPTACARYDGQQTKECRYIDSCPDQIMPLKAMSTSKSQPMRHSSHSLKGNLSSPSSRIPLRSVNQHAAIIANALRERFKTFQVLSKKNASVEKNGEWYTDRGDEDNCLYDFQTNVARSLLRKLDKSQVPVSVWKDLDHSSD